MKRNFHTVAAYRFDYRVLVCFLAILLSFGAFADTIRRAENFGIQYDVISSGSTPSASTNYYQPQSVIGDIVAWSAYTGTTYISQPVGVIPLPANSSGVSTWEIY